MTDRIDVDALLATVDLVALVDSYVPLKKAGAEYEACCPFHTENSPSFKVNAEKGFFHCFGCGAHGNAIGFLMQHKGIDFLEAVAELGGADVPARSVPVPAVMEREVKRSPWVPIVPAPANAGPRGWTSMTSPGAA
jgi:DNA primase catalytic core